MVIYCDQCLTKIVCKLSWFNVEHEKHALYRISCSLSIICRAAISPYSPQSHGVWFLGTKAMNLLEFITSPFQ